MIRGAGGRLIPKVNEAADHFPLGRTMHQKAANSTRRNRGRDALHVEAGSRHAVRASRALRWREQFSSTGAGGEVSLAAEAGGDGPKVTVAEPQWLLLNQPAMQGAGTMAPLVDAREG